MSHSVIISLNGIPQNPVYVNPNEKVREILKRFRKAEEDVSDDTAIILASKGLVVSEEQSLEEQSVLANDKREYHLVGFVKLSSATTTGHMSEDLQYAKSKCDKLEAQIKALKDTFTSYVQKTDEELRRRPKGYVQLMYPGSSVWVLPPSSSRAQTKLTSPQAMIKLSEKWILTKNKDTTQVYQCAVNSGIIEHTIQFDNNPSAGVTANGHADSSTSSSTSSAVEQIPPAATADTISIKVWCVRVMLPSKSRSKARWGDYSESITEHLAIGGWEYSVFDTVLQKDIVKQVRLLSDLSICETDDEYYCYPTVESLVPTKELIKID